MNVAGQSDRCRFDDYSGRRDECCAGLRGLQTPDGGSGGPGRARLHLVTSRGLESSGGVDGLLSQPGLSLTPAGKEKHVIVMDDLILLGFGPRLGQAVKQLCDELHPAPKTTQR